MTAKELAATVAALAALGIIAVGIDEVRDEAQKDAFAAALADETGKVIFRDAEARYSDGGWKFSADTFDVVAVSTHDLGTGYAMRAGAGSSLVVLDESPCVIPDCTDTDGGWSDAHAPVDCVFSYPGESRRWRGCNVGAKAYASGAACLPSACVVGAP